MSTEAAGLGACPWQCGPGRPPACLSAASWLWGPCPALQSCAWGGHTAPGPSRTGQCSGCERHPRLRRGAGGGPGQAVLQAQAGLRGRGRPAAGRPRARAWSRATAWFPPSSASCCSSPSSSATPARRRAVLGAHCWPALCVAGAPGSGPGKLQAACALARSASDCAKVQSTGCQPVRRRAHPTARLLFRSWCSSAPARPSSTTQSC